MRRNRRKPFKYLFLSLSLALFLFLLLFLLLPLRSPDFAIPVNKKALSQKQKYLAAPATTHHSPNILLITVDDLGMADCSLYGEGKIETPHIDELGAQGVIFENAYVTSPVCAPSRAAIITGRYQQRFGFEFTMQARYLRNRMEYLGFRYIIDSDPWVPKWMAEVPDEAAILQQGLPPSELTLAEILKKHGYRTGITGKWHLGWVNERKPNALGFDEQYGFFHSHSLYIPEETPGYVDQKIDGDWTDPHIWSGQRNDNHAIHRNGVEIEETGYLTDRITEESIDFMERNAGRQPFFLWTSYSAPHTPLQAPAGYVERFMHIEDPVRRVYRAMIANLDDNLGRLMEFLKSSGLEDNTLVFFISDNGGAEYTLTTDNGRYDGGKNTEFEGGIKVPMAMKWKGEIAPGQRFSPMVSALDIFPTALAAARVDMMPGRKLDGTDLVPYLNDTSQSPPHEYLFWQRGISKVVRNNEWKLVMNGYAGDTLLYNLEQDRFEGEDLAREYPEILQQLKIAHRQWQESNREPLWPSVIWYTAMKDGKRYYFEQ